MFVLENGGQTIYSVDCYWIQQEKVLFRQSRAIWIQYNHTPERIVVVNIVRHRQYDQSYTTDGGLS